MLICYRKLYLSIAEGFSRLSPPPARDPGGRVDPHRIERWPHGSSGSIVGWGSQVVGVDLSEGFIAVAGGGYHSLGLKGDGSIVAWGSKGSGQTNVPGPNTGFVAVAGGLYHSLGIRTHLRDGADGPPSDWDRNGVVDTRDLAAFLADWAAGEVDFSGDGLTDSHDVVEFLGEWASVTASTPS